MQKFFALYNKTLRAGLMGLKNNFLPQQNTRMKEADEIMENPLGVHEYLRAMESDYGLAYTLILSKLSRVLRFEEEGTALEVGCGPCILTAKMASAFPKTKWLGIDGSDAMLALAEKRIREEGMVNLGVKKMHSDEIQTLPESFDVILLSLMLHHAQDEEAAVRLINDCVRKLKPGGTLLIFDFVRPKTDAIALWICDTYIHARGSLLYNDSLASLRAAFTFPELTRILERSEFENYEHARDLLNLYQFVCTKAPHHPPRSIQSKTIVSRLALLWYRALFFGKMSSRAPR